MTKEEKMVKLIDQAIESVDECLSVVTLAKSIATILKENYGVHNFDTFTNTLNQELNK
jgi:lactam utilization protein B